MSRRMLILRRRVRMLFSHSTRRFSCYESHGADMIVKVWYPNSRQDVETGRYEAVEQPRRLYLRLEMRREGE